MTKSYSNDLSQRVIEYLDEGGGYIEASQLFKNKCISDRYVV
ncbi:IS630 transposase-related protein [Holospora undulata]|nr:IS630 transposase-related protein [Holospora undulata]